MDSSKNCAVFEKDEDEDIAGAVAVALLLLLTLRLTSWQGSPSTAENQASAPPCRHLCATCCE